ncbi:hypothetical protein NPX79_00215 [Spiroplasma endosymbiont of Anurida maritima]|uniref:hypothetical protein n=1 Tax=Spiroplasma endosymbiont of Anurida maritima TaxID=2967972 RepID=UPI0036D2D178
MKNIYSFFRKLKIIFNITTIQKIDVFHNEILNLSENVIKENFKEEIIDEIKIKHDDFNDALIINNNKQNKNIIKKISKIIKNKGSKLFCLLKANNLVYN